ncbi:hypothetical protein G4G27_11545 [Sphingomonas sp. So64.6b]|uniref:hypothetical protein n=1 Tax=Sphingomonas sp. So64.6b TaxID=2997354 RepID=UPI001603ABE6|nr:hypothetical protein [Sphingomonas sp. So64.6b]QNA84554.1 hypothetical protein G4G27_11545 [Sphingomonas sp. So64.6b]
MRAAVILGLLALSACDRSAISRAHEVPERGWYFDDTKPGLLRLTYGIGDGSNAVFVGICNERQPAFFLTNSGRPDDIQSFDLQIDAWRVTFDVQGGETANSLFILPGEQSERGDAIEQLADRLAAARNEIVFSGAKGWRKQVPASPLISRFVKACRAR